MIIKINRDAWTKVRKVWTSSMDPTGFDEANPTFRGDISFADGTPGVLTIEPQGGETYFNIWINGVEFRKTSAETINLANTEGLHYIYYDIDLTLKELVNPSDQQIALGIRSSVFVAIIYWDLTNQKHIWFNDERHLNQMDGSTHANLHFSLGTQWRAGGALGDFVLGDGNDNEDAQFSYGTGTIQDEDISNTESNIASTVGYPILYLDNGNWRTKTQAGFPIMTDVTAGIDTTGRTVYNDFTTPGSETLVVVGDKEFVLVHILQTNGAVTGSKVWAVMGQETYEKKKDARLGATTEVNNLITRGLPGPEFMFLGSVIMEVKNGYGNAVKARVIDTDLGDDYVDWRTGTGLSPTSPATSHSALSGLANDDHLQYPLLTGRSGDTLLIDTLNEFTTDAGVTIETVKMEDGDVTGTSFTIGANVLTTDEFRYLDGQNQALKTTDDVTFDDIIATKTITTQDRDVLRYILLNS